MPVDVVLNASLVPKRPCRTVGARLRLSSESRRAGRRNHGLAHRGASGERRDAGGAAGYSVPERPARRHRGAGPGSSQEEPSRRLSSILRWPRGSSTGNFDDDLALLAGCDWVIEAVTENLDIKQALLDRVAPHLKPDAILTTNTSGLPVRLDRRRTCRKRCAGAGSARTSSIRRATCGWWRSSPTPETDPAVVEAISRFADLRLGKEVVFARDTPNFIANRIGVFIMLEAVRLMQEEDLTIEEVDALTGTAIGWPRTGTFRLADLVGLDVLAHVAGNFARSRCAGGQRPMESPPFIQTMLERRWLGDKTRQGFYRKEKDAAGKEIRFALDWKTLEYHPAARSPSCLRSRWRRTPSGCRSASRVLLERRRQEGQGRALPLAAAERAVELRGRLPAGDRRRRFQRRPRHARRLQLGDGAVRAVGRRRRAARPWRAWRRRASR